MHQTDRMTFDEFLAAEGVDSPEWVVAIEALANRAWGRGDDIVVYQNHDLGHPELGMLQVTTYGSAASMLEREQFPDGPPEVLPDIGGQINWRYGLIHVFPPTHGTGVQP